MDWVMGRKTLALWGLLVAAGCLADRTSADSGGEGDGTTTANPPPTVTTAGSGSGAPTTAGEDGGDDTPGTTASGSATGASETSGGSGSTDAGSDDGCSFIPEACTDYWNTGDEECSVWAQNCPAGEKCMPWANDGGNVWNATKCTPIAPNPRGSGDPCEVEGNGVSGVDNCGPAMMCWDVDVQTNAGVCVPMCVGSPAAPHCEDPCSSCLIANDGVLILCLPLCDPLIQDCPEGQACHVGPDAPACVLDASGGNGPYKQPCEFVNACDPGLACMDPAQVVDCMGAGGCCTPFCDLGGDPCPDQDLGMECIPFFEPGQEPPCLEAFGVCMLP